jgi:deoxyribodipyrimidine photo-lyase
VANSKPHTHIQFPTYYASVLARIDEIDPLVYGRTRNFIDGAVTYLSPYISRGVISVRQVQQAVLSRGYKPYQIEKFLQELAWREYFQRVWQAKGDSLFSNLKQPQQRVSHHEMIDAVVQAKTGISSIDLLLNQFYETGYMHNHVRMYVASMVCNIGQAHWLAPSQWMYYHLLDGDLASNTCSWQWVAGAFASKPYYCNQENINRFTHSDQYQTFLDLPMDTLPNAPIPDVLRATTAYAWQTNLPKTDVFDLDVTKPTLVYNSYNMDPLWRKDENVNRVLLLEPSHFQKYPVSDRVIQFILGLSQNIPNIKIVVGEIADLISCYVDTALGGNGIISKEHPAFVHYSGQQDARDWLYPHVTGYYPSFFGYWKKCSKEVLT